MHMVAAHFKFVSRRMQLATAGPALDSRTSVYKFSAAVLRRNFRRSSYSAKLGL